MADAAGAWNATFARASCERLRMNAETYRRGGGGQQHVDRRLAHHGTQTLGEHAQLLVRQLGKERIHDGHAQLPRSRWLIAVAVIHLGTRARPRAR